MLVQLIAGCTLVLCCASADSQIGDVGKTAAKAVTPLVEPCNLNWESFGSATHPWSTCLPPTAQRSAHVKTRLGWLIPRFGRRRRRRQAPGKNAGLANNQVRTRSIEASTSWTTTVSPLLASVIGAMLAVGGTTTLWPQVAHASPFDPRPPSKSPHRPFFEGWFIRYVACTNQQGSTSHELWHRLRRKV